MNKTAKRCEYCGGTMWLDDDVLKCFMCSRPAKGQDDSGITPTRQGQPKLPGTQVRNAYKRGK